TNQMIDDAAQRDALNALIATLDPQFLAIPERVIALIPPQPSGYRRDRELFKVNTGLTFDPIAAAESSVEHTLDLLLHPQRLARLVEHSARD
ncbi:zinc-dependent metalloprotease, partial [Klebsiella pneumoniae]|uniref:zinc-dependent metalloprotease n=1 Tax=Klebsiella pneumoniae TaxID=573 RepID=UPI003A892E84